MATRSRSRKARTTNALQPVRQTLRRLEQEGSRLVARARKDATRYLSAGQQRALVNLVRQARRLGADVEKRIRRSRREFETRAEKVVARMERRAALAMGATIKHLNLVTQADLRLIEERVARLESRNALGEQPVL